MSVEEEKSEVLRRSIPFGRLAEIASTKDSVIWPTDVSAYYGGRGVAADKAQRIRAAAAKLIDLHDSLLVTPNWKSGKNVREALARLEQVRGTGAVVEPWKSSSAQSAPTPHVDVTQAGRTLSGAQQAE